MDESKKKILIIAGIGILILLILGLGYLLVSKGGKGNISDRTKFLELAKIYMREGYYDRALDYLDRVFLENPNDPEV